MLKNKVNFFFLLYGAANSCVFPRKHLSLQGVELETDVFYHKKINTIDYDNF